MGGKHSKDKSTINSSSSSSLFKFRSKSKQIHKLKKKSLKTTKSASYLPIPQYAIPYSNSVPKKQEIQKSSPQHEKIIEYKLYRSYSDLHKASNNEKIRSPRKSIIHQPDSPANVKVYRKSSDAERFHSLLRNHQKQRRVTCAGVQSSKKTEISSETSRFNTISAGQFRHNSKDISSFSKARTSSYSSLGRTYSFKKAVSCLSTSSIGYNVSASDMPSVSRVKKKTRQFELSFVRRLSDLIDFLPIEKLIQQIVVGVIKLPPKENEEEENDCYFITIEKYLLKKDKLDEIMIPFISHEILHQLKESIHYSTKRNYNVNEKDHLSQEEEFTKVKETNSKNDINNNVIKKIQNKDNKTNNMNDVKEKSISEVNDVTINTTQSIIKSTQLSEVLKQIVNSYLISISKEISRIYEYQIALMSDGLSMDLLSRYAADCVSNFVEFSGPCLPIFHVDSAVHSVVWANPTKSKLGNSTLSILIGEKELKWKIAEIFQKPGLRLDNLLYAKDEITIPEHHPWRFFSHDNTELLLYGYRSAVIDKSPRPDVYRLHRNEMCFNKKVEWIEEDFHRCYTPYRKLVGRKVMRLYKKMNECKTNKDTFTFSTPKQDLSIRINDFEILENKEDHSQILSFTSFIPFLLGDDVGKEDMEVVCRCLENENKVYSHFKKFEIKDSKDFNTNNNNSNEIHDNTFNNTNDFKSFHDEKSFHISDLEYTKELDSVSCIENYQGNNSSSFENAHTSKQMKSSQNQKNKASTSNNDINNSNITINNEINDITNDLKNQNLQVKANKNVFKYALTPMKLENSIDKICYIPEKQVNSLELEDLYIQSSSLTCSNEDLTTTTTSECFDCGENDSRINHEQLSECEAISNHLNKSCASKLKRSPQVSDHSVAESKKSLSTNKSSHASDV